MRTIIIFCSLFWLTAPVYSQINQATDFKRTMDTHRFNKMLEKGVNPMLSANDIDGSPYLHPEFIAGTVYLQDSQRFEGIDLRYNIYADQIEFSFPDEEPQFLATPELVEKIEIGDTTIVYLPYANNKKTKKGYFLVLAQGKASLYARPEIFFKRAIEPAAYQDAQPPKFERKPDQYFIQSGKNPARPVDSKKELINAFPDHRESVSKFINKNNIKTRDPEHLLQVVAFYNSL